MMLLPSPLSLSWHEPTRSLPIRVVGELCHLPLFESIRRGLSILIDSDRADHLESLISTTIQDIGPCARLVAVQSLSAHRLWSLPSPHIRPSVN